MSPAEPTPTATVALTLDEAVAISDLADQVAFRGPRSKLQWGAIQLKLAEAFQSPDVLESKDVTPDKTPDPTEAPE